MRVWVLLGKHEFAAALELARALNKQMPDDLLVYGFLTDADVELGRLQGGRGSVSVDARPAAGQRPGVHARGVPARALRRHRGRDRADDEGVSSALPPQRSRGPRLAAHAARPPGARRRVEPANADRILQEALKLFPDYHYALATLARVRSAQKKHGEAAALLKRRYAAAPHPENLYALARGARSGQARVPKPRRRSPSSRQQALKEAERLGQRQPRAGLLLRRPCAEAAEALAIAELGDRAPPGRLHARRATPGRFTRTTGIARRARRWIARSPSGSRILSCWPARRSSRRRRAARSVTRVGLLGLPARTAAAPSPPPTSTRLRERDSRITSPTRG